MNDRTIDALFYDSPDAITNGDTPVAVSNVTIKLATEYHPVTINLATERDYLIGFGRSVTPVKPEVIPAASKPADPAFANALRPHRYQIGLRYLGD